MRLWWKDPLLLGDVLLVDIRLQGAVEIGRRIPLTLGRHHIHAEDWHRRSADGHGSGGLPQGDTAKENVHIDRRVNRHPAVADLTEAHRVVGISTHQCRHVESHREAVAAPRQNHLIALIGLLSIAEPRELPDRPGFPAITRGVQPPGERELTRPADPFESGDINSGGRAIHRLCIQAAQSGEIGIPYPPASARLLVSFGPANSTCSNVFGVHFTTIVLCVTRSPTAGDGASANPIARPQSDFVSRPGSWFRLGIWSVCPTSAAYPTHLRCATTPRCPPTACRPPALPHTR